MIKITGYITPHIKIDDLYQNQTDTMVLSPETVEFVQIFEEFIVWVNREVNIHGCQRSKQYNKAVGGNARSNHLAPSTALDCDIKGVVPKEKFEKYGKKWKEICSKHGKVGEIGLYTWGFHFGIQTYSKTFYYWDSRSGKQINKPKEFRI